MSKMGFYVFDNDPFKKILIGLFTFLVTLFEIQIVYLKDQGRNFLKISSDFSRSIEHFLIKIRQLLTFVTNSLKIKFPKINLNQPLDQKRSGPSRSRRLFIFWGSPFVTKLIFYFALTFYFSIRPLKLFAEGSFLTF